MRYGPYTQSRIISGTSFDIHPHPVIRPRYKKPRPDQPTTPTETHNRYTALGDLKLKIARCDEGENTPVKSKRPPPIVIGTEVSVQYLKNLMLTNVVRCFNIGQNKTAIRLFTETLEDHSKAVKVMDSTNVEFNTYSTKGEPKSTAGKKTHTLTHGAPFMRISIHYPTESSQYSWTNLSGIVREKIAITNLKTQKYVKTLKWDMSNSSLTSDTMVTHSSNKSRHYPTDSETANRPID